MGKNTNDKGDGNMTPSIERYCTVAESVEASLKEVKAMREGKAQKRNWRDAFKELRDEMHDDV